MPEDSGVYFQRPGSGARCSTARSARLRQRRFEMGYEDRDIPLAYSRLADEARRVFLAYEEVDPALARAQALAHVVGNCPVTLERDALLVGGEDPFFFNLMFDTLQADRYARTALSDADPAAEDLRRGIVFMGPCFEGHIIPAARGVHAMVPRDEMCESARKLRDTYAITPSIPLFKREFGFYSLDAWREQGMPQDVPHAELFDLDPPGNHSLGQLGWCEAAFEPAFEVKVVQDRGDYELEQDHAGRHVLYFKGRRSGFMPEYVDHPVVDRRTWEGGVKWRLDPASSARYADLAEGMECARRKAALGKMITQNLVGGYMYLRSLIGPADLLYAFYDMPDVIHDCMETWLRLADAVIARHQEHVTLDEFFIAEDICYNHGPLISPDMMRKFLLPYYQQLIANVKARQIDQTRHLYVQVDTDGYAAPVVPLYREAIGMDAMSPFEVASGCDVVEIGRRHSGLAIFGGIDKRVLAQGRAAIDAHLEAIVPAMRARGGYIPTSDHGVPAEVPYEDYLYYRKRCVELGG